MPYENYARQFRLMTRRTARLALLAAQHDQFRWPVETWTELNDLVTAQTTRALWEAGGRDLSEFGGPRGRLRRAALRLARFFDDLAMSLE